MRVSHRAAAWAGVLFFAASGFTSINLAAEAAAADPTAATAVSAAPAPGFSEKDIFGRDTIDLRNYRGKVVILNFWATWCPPCREEIPALEAIQRAYGKDVAVIGVSVYCSSASTELFYAEYKINYPMIYGSYELMGEYGRVAAIPTTFVITRDGKIADRVQGARSQGEYEAMLKPLLAR